jgi:hypothetical protein
MGQVIVVPNYDSFTGPLIFLAGPIQGASDWQTEAIEIIQAIDPAVNIANPRSPPPWHGDFTAQVIWEHSHLASAGHHGVVMFWLAREAEHFCNRAYAQTSRFELGWQMTLSKMNGNPIVVGIEPGFTNERYLRLALAREIPELPIFCSLYKTCLEAVLLCPRT